jgi:ADP-dependent NAD(P)H-hydrate dehydratase
VTPVTDALLRSWPLPECPSDADKVQRGTVLVIAGGVETAGAALLAGIAALRAGAGRLTVLTARRHSAALAVALPEARVIPSLGPDPSERDLSSVHREVDAILVGPGLRERSARGLATTLLSTCTVPLVLDAGAIPALRFTRTKRRGPALITPHAGELAHLEKVTRDEIEQDPAGASRGAMERWQMGVVLKGATTHLCVPGDGSWIHKGGNAGLATSGSGDVLAGLIVGLLARGASLVQAAAWGVALHARAGENLALRFGPVGYLAREIADEVPALMAKLARKGTRKKSP